MINGKCKISISSFGNIDHTTLYLRCSCIMLKYIILRADYIKVRDAVRLSTRSEINVFLLTASSIEFIRGSRCETVSDLILSNSLLR
ncbi:hypothetical protein V1478_015964 [Vespula squamosa]|uniref:Uncharacterized protein n=1 Tax=Vespula squamosa TaxID=30214 RepID=A0ABD2A2B9_VESSQ